MMTLLPASGFGFSLLLTPTLDLSSKGGSASSYATAGIFVDLRITYVLKTPHHDKVQPTTGRIHIFVYIYIYI